MPKPVCAEMMQAMGVEPSNIDADDEIAFRPRSRRVGVFVLLAIVAGIAPAITLLWVSRQRALARSQTMLENLVVSAVDRIDRAFRQAEVELERLATDASAPVDEELVARLQLAVYTTRYFREAGIIDEHGELVCTSLGPVQPPVPIAADMRSRPELRKMQIVGVVTTEIMQQRSIILGLPTRGRGEVNLLMDPDVMTEMFEQFSIGPDGFIEVGTSDGRTLARSGGEQDETTTQPADASAHAREPAEHLAQRLASQRFPVVVTAVMDREWALREWYGDVLWMTPLVLAASAALAALVLRLGSRPASIRDDLRIALRRGEFEAHYQPIMDLGTGRCIGAEALIRWNHPREGAVRPDVFIGVAEDTGLIEPLTEWLIDRVGRDLGEMLRSRDDLHVGINLAPRHFNSRDIIESLQRILRPYQVPLEKFTLEMTERSMVGEDVGLSREVMQSLRALGMRIAIDDFGTGYSSLAYLHTFQFDALKIDASFVRRIGVDSIGAGVIDAIIDLGHALDVTIVAEGVETREQFDFLHGRGVHAAQGWHFARAMPAAEFLAFTRKVREARPGLSPVS